MPEAPRLSYIVCATPRCGSSLLCCGLLATGLAGRPDEAFHQGVRDEARDRRRLDVRTEAEYIPQLLRHATTGNGVFGTKLHGFQTPLVIERVRLVADEPVSSLRQAIERFSPNPRYVWLTRDDKVKEAVSFYRALMSDTWFALRGTERNGEPKLATVEFDPVAIGKCHMLIEAGDLYWQGSFATHGIEPLTLTYETLVRTYDDAMRRVFSFLDLPNDTPVPAPALEKLANTQSNEWAERYHALAQQTSYLPHAPASQVRHWAPY